MTEPTRKRSRSPAGACLLAAVLIVAACAPEAEPVRTTATFPIRLFAPARADTSILELPVDSEAVLESWQVLEFQKPGHTGAALGPSVRDPRASVRDGTVVLDESTAALVRVFELPPLQSFELNVRLAPSSLVGVEAGDPCERFYLVRLAQLPNEQTFGEWFRHGMEAAPGPEGESIQAALLERLADRTSRPSGAKWTSRADAEGMATAMYRSRSFEKREAWALIVLAAPGGARFGPAHFTTLPELHSPYRANSEHVPDPVVRPTKLSGRSVLAMFLPPGASVVREVEIPRGVTGLSLSIGTDALAPSWMIAEWTVEVETAPDEWLVLGTGKRARDGANATFYDHDLAWPDEAPTNTSARIRVRMTGEVGLFVGQPILRGPPHDERPNLLFISLDTLRADHLGCYGYDRPTSPFLDAWSESAALFTDVVAVAPYTLPTHATMFTGLMPLRHGAVRDRQRLDTRRVAYLPEILAVNGYATAAFTGGGLVSDEFGFGGGFDRYGLIDPILERFGFGTGLAGSNGKTSLMDGVSEWIEARVDERWFVFLHSYATHEYSAPKVDLELFDTHPELPIDRETLPYFKQREWLEDAPTPGEIEHLTNLYDGTIHHADRVLGRLLGRLEEQGLLQNTVVVITSDHGEELWEHGSLGHAITVHQELLQVPLMVRVPGEPGGRRIDRPVSQADLTPTLLELLDLPPLRDADGVSRASWIRGAPTTGQVTPLYAHVDTRTSRRATLRVDSLKVLRGDTSPDLIEPASTAWRLYDLATDPGETDDLAGRLTDVLAGMRAQLEAFERALAARALAGTSVDLSPELLQQLEELGY